MKMPSSAASFCCFSARSDRGNGLKAVPLDNKNVFDFKILEIRTKRQLRVIHVQPHAFAKAKVLNTKKKSSKCNSIISNQMPSHLWTNDDSIEGENPGNIWLYYEQPFNYHHKLFKKILNPNHVSKFAQNIAKEIIENVYYDIKGIVSGQMQHINTMPTKLQHAPKQLNDCKPQITAIIEDSAEFNLPGSCVVSNNCKANQFNLLSRVQKPVVIFIHDIGSSAQIWEPHLTYLSSYGYETIAMDLIGHGLSCRPFQSVMYNFLELVKDVLALIDMHCPEKEKCVLVAHGFSCEIACAIAKSRPQQIAQMAFVGFGLDEHSIEGLHWPKHSNFSDKFKRLILKTTNHQNQIIEWIRASFVEAKANEDHLWYYRSILVPTLIIHGLQNDRISLDQVDLLHHMLARSYVELVTNGGHMCMQQCLDKFNSILHYFLQSCPVQL